MAESAAFHSRTVLLMPLHDADDGRLAAARTGRWRADDQRPCGPRHRDDKAVTRLVVAGAGVRVPEQMETGPERRAVETARQFSKRVIIEAMVDGTDPRILVIDP